MGGGLAWDFEGLREEQSLAVISQQLGKDIHSVAALNEMEGITISRDEKVVIRLHFGFADK